MSETHIKPQCQDCVFFDVRNLPARDKTLFEIRALRMALEGTDEFSGCRHPWRVMNAIYGSEPNQEQLLALNSLAKVRGKDPQASGIPEVEKEISTLDT